MLFYDFSQKKREVIAGDSIILLSLHQHDAPRSDFSAEKLLVEAGLDRGGYESE